MTSGINEIPELSQRMKHEFYTIENGLVVLTERFHLQRGSCCGNGCRHCPFIPRAQKGNHRVQPGLIALQAHLN